jgi:hypothetical protein
VVLEKNKLAANAVCYSLFYLLLIYQVVKKNYDHDLKAKCSHLAFLFVQTELRCLFFARKCDFDCYFRLKEYDSAAFYKSRRSAFAG